MMAVVPVPRVTVQDSLPEVIRDVKSGSQGAEDCWVSCYLEGHESVHGRVRVVEDDESSLGVALQARDGVDVTLVKPNELRVSCSSLGIEDVAVSFPASSPFTLRKGIDTFDISPDGTRFVVGGKDGLLRVGRTDGTGHAIELNGPLSDVRSVKFFPSGEVVLSASTDMSVRVFSAIDGSNPRTLQGHEKAVTAVGIIGVGKQVLSASMDCTIKLWTVASGQCDKTVRFTSPILDMALSQTSDDGVIIAAAHQNGKASVFTIDINNTTDDPMLNTIDLLGSSSAPPLFRVAFSRDGQTLLTGSRDGILSLVDLHSSTVTRSLRRSSASITSLACIGSGTAALVGNAEGLLAWIDLETGTVQHEYVSGDCESVVGHYRQHDGSVWSASQDGQLRFFAASS